VLRRTEREAEEARVELAEEVQLGVEQWVQEVVAYERRRKGLRKGIGYHNRVSAENKKDEAADERKLVETKDCTVHRNRPSSRKQGRRFALVEAGRVG
jgi:hypothetical protein